MEAFLASVSDPEFVLSVRYVDLLVGDIPENRRGDVITALYSVRRSLDYFRLRFIVTALLPLLSDPQLSRYLTTVSEELRTTTEVSAIRTILQMLTPELWPRVAEVPRLRIENKLIENKLIRDVQQAKAFENGRSTGIFGTSARAFMKRFALRSECVKVLTTKLEDTDADDRRYVARYFLISLPEIMTQEGEIKRAVRAISAAIRDEDEDMFDALVGHIRQFPGEWQSQIAQSLEDMTSERNPAVLLSDGTPFLEARAVPEITDDDIPF